MSFLSLQKLQTYNKEQVPSPGPVFFVPLNYFSRPQKIRKKLPQAEKTDIIRERKKKKREKTRRRMPNVENDSDRRKIRRRVSA